MAWWWASQLATMQQQLASIQNQLQAIQKFVEGNRPAKSLRIDFERTQYLNKKGKLTMSGSINCTDDHDVRVPLKWTDDVGTVSAPPAANTTGVSDNTAVVSKVDVAADDSSIVLRVAGDGKCNVTVTNGSLTDVIQVNVGAPSATALAVDAADAVQIAKGTAA